MGGVWCHGAYYICIVEGEFQRMGEAEAFIGCAKPSRRIPIRLESQGKPGKMKWSGKVRELVLKMLIKMKFKKCCDHLKQMLRL